MKKFKFDLKKHVVQNIPFVMFFFIANKLSYCYTSSTGEFADKITGSMHKLNTEILNPVPSFEGIDLMIGLGVAIGIKIFLYYRKKNAKQFRHGIEYGSARWGTEKDIEPYMDMGNPRNNIILTQTEGLMMGRPKEPKYARNQNVLVIGGSGSGKTRFFVKPNLMQMHSSYVITDPKGTVIEECGTMLKLNNYRIKVLNLKDTKRSMHYNPFNYIHSEQDILKLVTTIITNTTGDAKSGDDFWVKAEKLYLTALIGLIYYEMSPQQKNFNTLLVLINLSQTSEDNENAKNKVDELFDDVESVKPDCFSVRQYKKYKLAAGKTAKSILISCGARLAPFDISELRELMDYDEMELDTLGDTKTALFVIISDTDTTYNFVCSIMYSQLFDILCNRADNNKGKLNVPVRCILDEFANIGQIPNFDKLIATIRSRGISACVILQSKSQLNAIYKDNADTIVGNCDTTLFLGGKEKSTLKEISEALGKETIDMYNTSENRGRDTSHGLSYQKLGKELMTEYDLNIMDGSKCILQVRGVNPFLSKKYDITQHSQYGLLSDYNERMRFDIEKYLSHRYIVKPEEEFELIEFDGFEETT